MTAQGPTTSDEAATAAKAGFYSAAGRFDEAQPWETVGDGQILGIEIPALGWSGACASILGMAGEEFGLVLFRSLEDYLAFARLADVAATSGGAIAGPGVPLFSVNFDRPRVVRGGKALALEARAHGFSPGPRGRFPFLLDVRADGTLAPPTAESHRLAAACLDAVRLFVEKYEALFDGTPEEQYNTRWNIPTAGGEVEVAVTAPPSDLPWSWGEQEPIEGLREQDRDEVLDAFFTARQGDGAGEDEAHADCAAAEELLEFKQELGGALDEWTPDALGRYLLEYYPPDGRETGAGLEALPGRLDRFLAWLGASGRTPSPQVDAARTRLADCRDRFLRAAADPRRYGPIKCAFEQMRAAGVDPSDEAAVEAFMAETDRRSGDAPGPSGDAGRKPWTWDGEGPAPDPTAPCPCGSGRRYRKCCRPR